MSFRCVREHRAGPRVPHGKMVVVCTLMNLRPLKSWQNRKLMPFVRGARVFFADDDDDEDLWDSRGRRRRGCGTTVLCAFV